MKRKNLTGHNIIKTDDWDMSVAAAQLRSICKVSRATRSLKARMAVKDFFFDHLFKDLAGLTRLYPNFLDQGRINGHAGIVMPAR